MRKPKATNNVYLQIQITIFLTYRYTLNRNGIITIIFIYTIRIETVKCTGQQLTRENEEMTKDD